MSEEATQNITEQRAGFLENLKKQVDKAYKHRALESWDKDMRATKESKQKHRGLAKNLSNLPDEHILDTDTHGIGFPDIPSAVYVENPHDYKALLQLAFDKLVNEGRYDPSWVDDDIQKTLKHEFEHHVPALVLME